MKTFSEFLTEALNNQSSNKSVFDGMAKAITFAKSDRVEDIIKKVKIINDTCQMDKHSFSTEGFKFAVKNCKTADYKNRYSLFALCNYWIETTPDQCERYGYSEDEKLSNGHIFSYVDMYEDFMEEDVRKAVKKLCKLDGVEFDEDTWDSEKFRQILDITL